MVEARAKSKFRRSRSLSLLRPGRQECRSPFIYCKFAVRLPSNAGSAIRPAKFLPILERRERMSWRLQNPVRTRLRSIPLCFVGDNDGQVHGAYLQRAGEKIYLGPQAGAEAYGRRGQALERHLAAWDACRPMIAAVRPSPVRRHSGSYSGLQVRSPTAFRSLLAIPRYESRTDGQGQNSETPAHCSRP